MLLESGMSFANYCIAIDGSAINLHNRSCADRLRAVSQGNDEAGKAVRSSHKIYVMPCYGALIFIIIAMNLILTIHNPPQSCARVAGKLSQLLTNAFAFLNTNKHAADR